MESLEFAEILLEGGIPPNVTDNRGLSALEMSIIKGSFRMADLLISRGANVNELGGYGYTILGRLLEPNFAGQCDDHVASLGDWIQPQSA